jgi:alkylglycerol monooxygenase
MNFVMVALLAMAALELAYGLRKKKGAHTLRDTASSVAMGIGQQTFNVFLVSGFLGVYVTVHARFGLFAVDPGTLWQWVPLVILCDLAFYTGHRMAHEVNIFVAGHVPHHQAEDFNLLSSLRQGWAAWIQMAPYYLPLAVLGFPIEMLIEGQIGIMCAQFLSHYGATRVRLGVLDEIFITPENHRVHHGHGPRYGGKNCGGMLVIWDRLFGTFAQEDPADPVQIGNGLQLDFHDPIEAHLDYYRRIWFVSKSRKGLVAKIAIWFQSPGVLYRELAALDYEATRLNRAPVTPADVRLVVASGLLSIGLFFVHRALFQHGDAIVRLATTASTIGSLVLLGRVLGGWLPFRRAGKATEAAAPRMNPGFEPARTHPMSSSMRAA